MCTRCRDVLDSCFIFWDDIFRLFYGITQLLIVIVQFVLFSSLSICFLVPFTLAHLTDFNLRCGRPKNMKMFYDSQNTWKRDRYVPQRELGKMVYLFYRSTNRKKKNSSTCQCLHEQRDDDVNRSRVLSDAERVTCTKSNFSPRISHYLRLRLVVGVMKS